MTRCEVCKTLHHDTAGFVTDVNPGTGEQVIIGPCCIGKPRNMTPQVDYHFEVSSKNGLVASLEFGDLRLEYKKSQEQLRQAFTKKEQPQEEMVH